MPPARPRIVTLVSGLGWHVEDLRRAATSLDIELEPLRFDRLTAQVATPGFPLQAENHSLANAHALLVRMMPPGSLEQVVFRMDALHLLAQSGLPVVNSPRAVEISVDKYLSLALLHRARLPVPPTFAVETAKDALAAFEALGGDVIVKPLFGSEGRGLVRVSDPELARRTFHTLEHLNAVIYVQKTINHPGHDFRAFVLGGRVLCAMRRFAPSGDWRTNIAIGGRPEACRLDSSLETLALAAANAVGATLAGVDILIDLDKNAPLILEVNAVPGWRALSQAAGVDIASEILSHLRDLRS